MLQISREDKTLNVNAAMRELPEIFRAVAAQRTEYARVIHETRWAEGPVTIIAAHDSIHAALAGAQAIEYLIGWPTTAREAGYFSHYSAATLRPRSIVLAVSGEGEDEELDTAAAAAARRGATMLAVTWNNESALARNSVLPLPAPIGESPQLASRLILHAALLEIAIAAARIFNPRNPRLENIDFDSLPGHAGSMNLHLADPIRAMAAQVKDCRRLVIAGGGFYGPPALEAAALARQTTGKTVEAVPVEAEFAARAVTSEDAFLFLSGSHCGIKKRVHAAAGRLAATGAKVFAATDGNDRALIDSSGFSILMPETSELAGSLLSLFLVQRLILELGADPAK